MAQVILPTDLFVSGNVACKSFTPPAGSVGDAAIQQNAGIQATKVNHQHEKIFAQDSTVACTSERKVVHVVFGANATVVGFEAGAISPATGTDTVNVDLWKNGVSILSTTIALTSSQTARELITGTLDATTAVAGDVFEVNVVYNHVSGTAPQGVFAMLTIQEAPE